MTTKTARKPKTADARLSRGAEAVRRHLHDTGDSIAAQIAGEDLYWSFARSGLPVRGRDVRELKAAGVIASFGGEIDPAGPAACYVLTGNEALRTLTPAPVNKPRAGTECGAARIEECKRGGLCLSCAPSSLVERIRTGENHLPKAWTGPRP